MAWWLLAPLIVAAVVAAYVLGHRRGSRPWREEERQREIERDLTGQEVSDSPASGPPLVVRRGRMEGTHSWEL